MEGRVLHLVQEKKPGLVYPAAFMPLTMYQYDFAGEMQKRAESQWTMPAGE